MKCVIFDMDGVIFDSESLWKKATKDAGEYFKINISEEFRQSCCGKSEEESSKMFSKQFFPLDGKKIRNWIGKRVKEYVDNDGVPLKSGFSELIDYLKSKGVKIALATGASIGEVESYFKYANIDYKNIFSVVTVGNEVSSSKPSPDIYLKTCKKLKLNPKECYVIEDSSNGIFAAYNAGCKPIMAIDIIKPSVEIKKMCIKVCDSLSEVKEYFLMCEDD